MLVAELARIRRSIGAEPDQSADLPEVVAQDHSLSPTPWSSRPVEDPGEAVERDSGLTFLSSTSLINGKTMPLHESNEETHSNALKVSDPRSRTTETDEATDRVSIPSRSESTKRKKQREGDVIDDLFRGL